MHSELQGDPGLVPECLPPNLAPVFLWHDLGHQYWSKLPNKTPYKVRDDTDPDLGRPYEQRLLKLYPRAKETR
jgi:hypothetical protein